MLHVRFYDQWMCLCVNAIYDEAKSSYPYKLVIHTKIEKEKETIWFIIDVNELFENVCWRCQEKKKQIKLNIKQISVLWRYGVNCFNLVRLHSCNLI